MTSITPICLKRKGILKKILCGEDVAMLLAAPARWWQMVADSGK